MAAGPRLGGEFSFLRLHLEEPCWLNAADLSLDESGNIGLDRHTGNQPTPANFQRADLITGQLLHEETPPQAGDNHHLRDTQEQFVFHFHLQGLDYVHVRPLNFICDGAYVNLRVQSDRKLYKRVSATDKRQVMTPKRRRQRNTPPAIELEIQRMASRGYTAPEIHKELPESERPTIRTVYRIISDKFPPDPSGSWRPLQSPVAPNLVLPVLADVVEVSRGRRVHLTNAEALRVEAVREAVPDLPPWEAYILAQAYVAAEYQKTDTEPLDTLLAFAPWRSIEHAERYYAALNRGWIQEPDRWPALLLEIAILAIPNINPDGIPARFIDKNKTPEIWAYHQRFSSAPKKEVGDD